MAVEEQDAVCNWKELFERSYDTKVKNVYMTSG
jgi:hypothetical protein